MPGWASIFLQTGKVVLRGHGFKEAGVFTRVSLCTWVAVCTVSGVCTRTGVCIEADVHTVDEGV